MGTSHTQPPEPRKDLIIHAVDWIDLQAGFVRVNRGQAEKILNQWRRVNDLTFHERALVLNRYDPAAT